MMLDKINYHIQNRFWSYMHDDQHAGVWRGFDQDCAVCAQVPKGNVELLSKSSREHTIHICSSVEGRVASLKTEVELLFFSGQDVPTHLSSKTLAGNSFVCLSWDVRIVLCTILCWKYITNKDTKSSMQFAYLPFEVNIWWYFGLVYLHILLWSLFYIICSTVPIIHLWCSSYFMSICQWHFAIAMRCLHWPHLRWGFTSSLCVHSDAC